MRTGLSLLSLSGTPPLSLALLPNTSEYLETSIDALAVTGVVWTATAGVENVVRGLGRLGLSEFIGDWDPNGDSAIGMVANELLVWVSNAALEDNVVEVV